MKLEGPDPHAGHTDVRPDSTLAALRPASGQAGLRLQITGKGSALRAT